MHPNPIFRQTPEARALAFAALRSFGVLSVAAAGEVLLAHIPFLLEGDRLEAHLVRSNPIARRLADGPLGATLIVSGPDGYISPDWYGEEDLVPTWNYIAVHLAGTVALAPAAGLQAHLERLSARCEALLAPKAPWHHAKMSDGVMERMMRQILPIEMAVTGVESTFKLNQNRSDSARDAAAAQLARGRTPGQETAALAGMMRQIGR
ncbi:MAG: FMN-binding negative transcriptional regulator [Pikeienuella sp.]